MDVTQLAGVSLGLQQVGRLRKAMGFVSPPAQMLRPLAKYRHRKQLNPKKVQKAVVHHFPSLLHTHRYDVALVMEPREVDEVFHLTIAHKRKWLYKVEIGLPEILKQS